MKAPVLRVSHFVIIHSVAAWTVLRLTVCLYLLSSVQIPFASRYESS